MTGSIITDRHPSGIARITESSIPAPAVGQSVCDPAFGTTVTRVTPAGFSLLGPDAFSSDAKWILTSGPGGGLVAFSFDPMANRVNMNNGSPVSVPVSYELLPHSEKGSLCSPSAAQFSRTEPDILYIAACGTRIFKYNLRAYDKQRPLAGLVAGSNSRSFSTFPRNPNAAAWWKKGPVFIDMSDIFGDLTDEGLTGNLDLHLSGNDGSFVGIINRGGYKNVQGYFVFRPGNNALWFAKGSMGAAGKPDPFFMLTGNYNGSPVNKRIIGLAIDGIGRYLTIWVCADAVATYDTCSTALGNVSDINSHDPSKPLHQAIIKAQHSVSHGSTDNTMALGHAGVVQALTTFYFDPPENKQLLLPDLFMQQSNWWGSYTSNPTSLTDRYGRASAAGFSTYSYDSWYGTPSKYTTCRWRDCRFANELILFNLSGTHYIRLAHNRSKLTDAGISTYWEYPRIALSQDGSFLTFASNWGIPGNAQNITSSVYVVRVPPAWKELLDDTLTITPTRISTTVDKANSVVISHPRNALGTYVLIADSKLSAASGNMASACYISLDTNGTIKLANSAGQFGNTGYLGSGGVIANSVCSVALDKSSLVRSNQGNQEYKLNLTFLSGWKGQTMRVIMSTDPTRADSWRDVGLVNGPVDDIGIFRISTAGWALDATSNGLWEDGWDKAFQAGRVGEDLPVTGRWASDRPSTLTGVFRQGGAWLLDTNGDGRWIYGVDKVCYFGVPDDLPIVGNWGGSVQNGRDKIGVYRRGWWYLDMNANCAWDDRIDKGVLWGTSEDRPVVGDWDGSGVDRAGLYRNGVFQLDINGDFRFTPGIDIQVVLGQPGDIPLSGRWFNDGVSVPTVFRPSTGQWITSKGVVVRAYGFPGDLPIKGSWENFRFWRSPLQFTELNLAPQTTEATQTELIEVVPDQKQQEDKERFM
ncbi:MAG: hypothetical protein IT282_17375 [Bacteroidetes bacterium]|nr:hypothetical protein [Bacteroidota bacterium]